MPPVPVQGPKLANRDNDIQHTGSAPTKTFTDTRADYSITNDITMFADDAHLMHVHPDKQYEH